MAAEGMQSHDQSRGNCPTASHPAMKKGRINAPILPKPARCAKSDRLLGQDEIVVSSRKMADWFSDSDGFRLLEELIECHGLAVLKRPLGRYPEEMMERATTNPIHARRE